MSRVFGIDLGTTNSLIAYSRNGVPTLISEPESGSPLLPSVVAFPEVGEILIGHAARVHATLHPQTTVSSVKRSMGVGPDRLSIRDRIYTPPEISALILRELKRRAEAALNEEVRRVVITVPAYFNDGQRQATRDAGRLAGLEVLRLVNEPTAAALAYGLDRRDGGVIAVYDLGGGTFDVSILRLQRGVFEVLATAGNTQLGGDDIDGRVADYFLQQIPRAEHDSPILRSQLRRHAERAKVALSGAERIEVVVPLSANELTLELTRPQLESLAAELVKQTLEPCRRALRDAGLAARDLDEVVLAGGATRMPIVRRQVEELFGRTPHTRLNPDEVVALGAAAQAGVLSGDSDILLLDVVPLSLGMETVGGVVERIIERNTTIPASASRVFTTFVDKQTAVDVHVVQGERELADDNSTLARFKLSGIEPTAAGIPRIEMTFLIDANGVLSVTARDQLKGTEHTVEIKPAYGLSDDEIEKMLADAIDHAAADAARRDLIDARNDAAAMLRSVRQAIAGTFIAIEEARAIEVAMAALEEALAGTEPTHIHARIEALNQATTPLAQRLMDKAIHTALSSKSVTTVG